MNRFQTALQDPLKAQNALLKELVLRASQTQYGKSFNLTDTLYHQFTQKVPIVNYEEICPWIERERAGEKNVLNPTLPLSFEKTSGSSGKCKFIPFSPELKGSFNEMFKVWIADLLQHGLGLKKGRIFMSISPINDTEISDDTEYLTPFLRFLLKPFILFPPKCPPDQFQENLTKTLLQAKDLEIISIWSPSYLLNLVDENSWPHLLLISCWTSGPSKMQANKLKHLFPSVPIQGKGLLATEAPITLPLQGVQGGVPLLNEVFMEFEDEEGNIHLIDQIQCGERYQLIISQKGGLTRYRLGDIVEVVGKVKNTPTFDFVRRAGGVSDVCGEKLHPEFVQAFFSSRACHTYLLVPTLDRYVLLTDSPETTLITELDQYLKTAYHYNAARHQLQLKAPKRLFSPKMQDLLTGYYTQKGILLGDIKDQLLISDVEEGMRLTRFVSDNLLACKG